MAKTYRNGKSKLKLKFVEDSEVNAGRGRRSSYDFASFIEELYKHPNKWAEFPEKIPSSNTAQRLKTQYKDIEVVTSGGNGLGLTNPDKKMWTVYIRYTPSEPVNEDLF